MCYTTTSKISPVKSLLSLPFVSVLLLAFSPQTHPALGWHWSNQVIRFRSWHSTEWWLPIKHFHSTLTYKQKQLTSLQPWIITYSINNDIKYYLCCCYSAAIKKCKINQATSQKIRQKFENYTAPFKPEGMLHTRMLTVLDLLVSVISFSPKPLPRWQKLIVKNTLAQL